MVWAETATVGPLAAFWVPASVQLGGSRSDQTTMIAAVVASVVCIVGAAVIAAVVGKWRSEAAKAGLLRVVHCCSTSTGHISNRKHKRACNLTFNIK